MVGEGSAKLDFGHTSEKKKRMFDLIKEEKELKEKDVDHNNEDTVIRWNNVMSLIEQSVSAVNDM